MLCVDTVISAVDATRRSVIRVRSVQCAWNWIAALWQRSAHVHICVLVTSALSVRPKALTALGPGGYFMYQQFDIHKSYVLPTLCMYDFVWIWEQTAFISLYSINWLVFYGRGLTLYSPVVTICTTSLTFNNSTFCPHSVFMCFVWISEQTAIISLHSINWLVL